jgi:hypothetical protein
MGDRGSKSDMILLNVSVKEQRVDGSSGNSFLPVKLDKKELPVRCTLVT